MHPNIEHHVSEEQTEEQRPSKSEMKRRVEALQKAGEALVELVDAQLTDMPLPDELRLAVQQARKLRNKHAAFKRQRQFIGRLMREIDAEPIMQALNDLESLQQAQSAHFHKIEYWRDRLLDGKDENALTKFIGEHPGIGVQQLRQQVAKARRERQGGSGKRAQRELFTLLRDMLSEK